MSYNGWSNYETWCVALWIDNDEALYHERLRIVQDVVDEANDGSRVQEVGEALKTWVNEISPNLGESLWSDLLTTALDAVNWEEIAEHWIEDADLPESDDADEKTKHA